VNIAEVLTEYAAQRGTRTAFCVNGGMSMFLNKALHDHGRIKVVYTHHEQAAVSAAEGYSKASNFKKPGVACVTAGPGVSNALTGLLSAFADSTPLLILAGQIKESDIDVFGTRTHGAQEIHSREIISPAVKAFFRITKEEFREQLFLIHEALTTGRLGPVFVEIPLNVQPESVKDFEELLESVTRSSLARSREALTESQVKRIVELIESASRITCLVGNGIRISNGNFKTLLSALNQAFIPRFYTWLSQDLEDFDSQLNFGCPGSLAPITANRALQDSDLVIFLGVRADLATTAFQRDDFGASGSRIIVDIDASELAKFGGRDRDMYINMDLADFLPQFLEIVQNLKIEQREWATKWSDAKTAYLEMEDEKLVSDGVTARDLAVSILGSLKTGTVVMSSSGYAAEGIARFYRGNGKVRFFHGGGLGSMGQGLSQGIGAITAREDENNPVWIIESDGGLWMAIHELATLKVLNAKNIVVFIMNNNGYASIYNSQVRHFDYHGGTNSEDGLFFPSWKAVAKLFNFEYIQISKDTQSIDFSQFANTEHVTIVDIELELTEGRGPMLKTTLTPEGPRTQKIAELDW